MDDQYPGVITFGEQGETVEITATDGSGGGAMAFRSGGSKAAAKSPTSDTTKLTITKTALNSVFFTSTHEQLINFTANFSQATGVIFKPYGWRAFPPLNNPVSQTKNTRLTADVSVFVQPKGLSFKLIGLGGFDWCNFESEIVGSTGSDQTVHVSAAAPLPNQVDILDEISVGWYIEITYQTNVRKKSSHPTTETITIVIDLGPSGPHLIYVTYDRPIQTGPTNINDMVNFGRGANELTLKRLEFTCGIAEGKSSLEDIVTQLWQSCPSNPPAGPSDAGWPIADGGLGDCDDHSTLLIKMCQTLGINGDLVAIYASTDADCLSPETRTDWANRYYKTVGIQKYLVYEQYLKLLLPGPNNFEGVAHIDTKWYAVWPRLVAISPLEVLHKLVGGPGTPNVQEWYWWAPANRYPYTPPLPALQDPTGDRPPVP